MIKRLISNLWRKMPRSLRKRVVRLTQSRFTVSAAAVVLNSKKEVLLLDHLLRPGNGWGLPGGFVDKGETPEQAVKRELFEETKIEITSLRFVKMHTNKLHIEVIFAGKYDGPVDIDSYEILSYGWFEFEKLPKGFNYGQKILIEKVLADEI